MTPLGNMLTAAIARDGPLPVDRYMALCLDHPEHGYYRRGDPLGARGDFITAPEISQIFGELIGLWAAEIWAGMGRPRPVHLVELGPGHGTLMADTLRAVEQAAPDFRAALRLHLVEISRKLRARQHHNLARARPVWHETFASVPDGPAIVLANEFFDALPIRQFQRDGSGWRERLIDVDADGRFRSVLGRAVADPPLAPAQRAAPVGAIVEICPDGIALARTLGARVATQGGAALIVDYGPPLSGWGDTLQAVRRHARADPLAAPGLTDLTAHVDFTRLAAAARDSAAVAYGPVPQGTFLHRLGIAARAAILLRSATARQARDIAAGVTRLIAPTEMGTLFKALAIAGSRQPTPPGFDPQPTALEPVHRDT
ncbi:MAG: SAM-dependent methyltransferase [Proteobacteria bacterium]|nr:SAM-dependent methyltransferase [Pseudomonadota bacterium]